LVRTFGLLLGRGSIAPPQVAAWHQLVTVPHGRAMVRTKAAVFPLIAGSGAWIPSGVAYSIELAGPAEVRLLYLRPEPAAHAEPALLEITPLLRELIARTVALGALDGRVPAHRRLAGVVTDEVSASREIQLQLPLPASGPARAAAEILLGDGTQTLHIDDVAQALSIDDVARLCGTSRRTLERAFARELGIGLAAWLRRARFIDALYALRSGASVTAAALEAGYAAPSAFIAAFRREFATTPGAYLK
jgi:AraC-like DNA-binding protein